MFARSGWAYRSRKYAKSDKFSPVVVTIMTGTRCEIAHREDNITPHDGTESERFSAITKHPSSSGIFWLFTTVSATDGSDWAPPCPETNGQAC